jgi:Domain of unknown function DUF29
MLERSLSEAKATDLYEQDFFLWTQQMATALREGRLEQLDLENLAEEIESLGRSDRRALQSRLVVLLHHLLKWRYQPQQRTGSWKGTLSEQRRRIRVLLEDSPSLRSLLDNAVKECYLDARRQASDETGLPLTDFPEVCPFLLVDILDLSFLPD